MVIFLVGNKMDYIAWLCDFLVGNKMDVNIILHGYVTFLWVTRWMSILFCMVTFLWVTRWMSMLHGDFLVGSKMDVNGLCGFLVGNKMDVIIILFLVVYYMDRVLWMPGCPRTWLEDQD